MFDRSKISKALCVIPRRRTTHCILLGESVKDEVKLAVLSAEHSAE